MSDPTSPNPAPAAAPSVNLTPNWTALAALGRALLLLGLAAFFGALVLPLTSGGALPASWAAWRPVLGTAFGAAVAQELIYVRTHLAQAAKALGLQLATKVVGLMLAAVLLVAILPGCAAFWGAAAPVLDCGSKVAEDAAQNMSVAQIVADLPAQCGMDAAAVMALIAASADPKVQHSAAHAEVERARAMLAPPAPVGCGK